MTVRAVTVYRVDCNTCKRPLVHRGSIEFASRTAADAAIADLGWLVLEDGKKHHCQTCREAIFAAMDATARGIKAALATAAARKETP